MFSNSRTACILLNWNGWRDTIECLESIFRISGQDFYVVVCDNASSDGSLEKIKAWARGKLLAESASPQLSHLISPPVTKPIPFSELRREQAETGPVDHRRQLVLIQNGANLGFAGGNNVGLRYALRDGSRQYFWVLNNDTVIEPSALSAMVRLMQDHPELGLCGSLNRSYYKPTQVQVLGGRSYSRWTGRTYIRQSHMIETGRPSGSPMDYVEGASMLASRAFLEKVGLMEESYFLYFEEIDWAMRAREKFDLGYAVESVIYHKEGASIGSSSDRMRRSSVSEKYLSRNRVLFTRRFFPFALPSVFAALCLAAAHRACRGDLARAKEILIWALKGVFYKTGRERRHYHRYIS